MAGCLTRWPPALVVAPMRWASSPTSSPTPMLRCMASRPAVRALRAGGMRPPSRRERLACCTGCGPLCSKTRTVKPRHRIPSRPDWTIRASDRNTPGSTEIGRAQYEPITDAEAMDAFQLLSRTEGIVPAIESAHALAGALKLGPRLPTSGPGERPLILVNLSGRGDKDVDTAITWFGLDTTGTASESAGASPGTGPKR